MPLTQQFIQLLGGPTKEIISTINKEFLQANDAKEILRFVGDPQESFAKLDPNCTYNDIVGNNAEVFNHLSNGDPKVFYELYKKASDIFKHVFAFLNSREKREVISGNEYELFFSAANSGSYPQVSFLVEEAKKLEQEAEQEILQPMISARNYQGFRIAILNTFGSEGKKEMKKIYQLILGSVSDKNRLSMITSYDGEEAPLICAANNDYVDLVEYIFNHVPDNQLREEIRSTIADNDFHVNRSNQSFEMIFQKAFDLRIEGIDTQQILLQHKDLLLDGKYPYFAQYFKKYASEETLEATLTSFLASPESKEKFFTQAIRRSKVIEPVVNSLILSPQIQPNLNYLSRNVGLVKISYGEHRRLAKSSRYLLAVVLDLKNDSNIREFANKAFSALFQEYKIQLREEEIIPINYSANISGEYIIASRNRLLDLYTKNPRLLLENDLNQTTIDRLQELRNELIKNFIKNFSQKYSNLGSQSDLTAEEKAKLAEEKANLTIKGLLENDGLKKFKNLANDVFLGLSDKFANGVIKEFSSYTSEITLKGLDGSERKVALEVIAEFFEKKSRDVILKIRERNQNNPSKNSNEDSGVKAAEPETESVASEEVNFTSKVPANEESKPNSNPNHQIENSKYSNLKRSQQSLYNSSENPNESSDKKQRT